MQRYTHHLNRIRNDIAAQPDPHARTLHDQRLVAAMNTANREPEVEIPYALHAGGRQEIKLVDDTTLAHLIEGKRIARTVRYLLPEGAGNQRLMLMHRDGFNRPMTDAAQTLGRLHKGGQWCASSAILAGSGNCREHAEVAFEIARSLGLPVALVANHSADHAFAVLYPESHNAVVMDPWTIFPSSCLLGDSSFKPDRELARHRVGDALPADFNLHNIGRLQERLDNVCGHDTLRNLFTEELRQFHGLRSIALDRMLHNHGLLHYHQLPPMLPTPQTQAEIDTLMAQMTEKILHEAANHVGVTSTFTDFPASTLLNQSGTSNQRMWARNKALNSAGTAARNAAHDESVQLALEQAGRSPNRRHTAAVTKTIFHTEMKGLGIATVEHTTTVTSQAKPMLWDTATHGPNILYRSRGYGSFSTIHAPQSLINAMQNARAKAQQQDFPERQREISPAPEYRATDQTATDAQLLHECMNVITLALQQLGTLHHQQPPAPDQLQQELWTLQEIDERFDDAPAAIKVKILMNMVNLLVTMHAGLLDRAVDYWTAWQQRTLSEDPAEKACQLLRNSWQQHMEDKRLEPILRRAVLQVTDAKTVFDTAADHLTNPAIDRDTVMAVMHEALPHITDFSRRAAAQARLDNLALAQSPPNITFMEATASQWHATPR